jgi:nucleoside recognition membrane protein YjiH
MTDLEQEQREKFLRTGTSQRQVSPQQPQPQNAMAMLMVQQMAKDIRAIRFWVVVWSSLFFVAIVAAVIANVTGFLAKR